MKKAVFLNKKGLKKADCTSLLHEVKRGKYGTYAKMSGFNYSEKQMLNKGYSIEYLNKDEIKHIENLESKRKKRIIIEQIKYTKNRRQKQIDICLKSNPLPIEVNSGCNPFVKSVCNLADTSMINAYHGCGKGMAYINKDNKLVAFHYGMNVIPDNIPNECKPVKVQFSCTQICF